MLVWFRSRSTRRLFGVCGIRNLTVAALLFPMPNVANVANVEAAAPQKERRPPNVLVLVSDDQRPDTISALGNPHIRTPHLDSLARRSVVMRRAICANPICTPSRAEILTGCTGFRNGVLDFSRVIDPQTPRWADTMRSAGYVTSYVGKWHNNDRPSLHGYQRCEGLFGSGGGKWWKPMQDYRGGEVTGYRGWVFQSADGTQKFPNRGIGLRANISEDFANAAIQVIKSRPKDKPFFLHVNFTAPHDPLLIAENEAFHYNPSELPIPPNWRPEHPFDHGNLRGRDEKLLPWPRTKQQTQRHLAAYYSVITHLDAQVGRVLAALKAENLDSNTIVIYTSDHGLAVGSHGLTGKQNMYEHTIGVPLLIAGPNLQPRESKAPIYLRDLFPTVCELCSAPLPKAPMDGISHADVLRGEAESHHTAVFGYFRQSQRMIRRNGWKLIRYPEANRAQLFHLKNDPYELKNLIESPQHQAMAKRLGKQLDQWLAAQQEHQPNATKTKQ